jgi:5-methylcytosine-specific restriction endonuclease McrA
MPNDNFYHLPRWTHKHASILRRDKYLCQESLRYGKKVEATIVHHIFPRDEYPEYAWCDWNLISLSQSKHNEMHDRTTNKLTAIGQELLERTRRKYSKEIERCQINTVLN